MAKATVEPIDANEDAIVHLTLDQINLDPVTDVRTGPKAKDEEEKIDYLAQSIFEQGQLQPILVRPNGAAGSYNLIAGRRRFAAFNRMRDIAESGKPQVIAEALKERMPLTIKALVVNKTDDEAFAAAIQENLQRRDFSAIDFAQNIADIRKRYDWNASDWSNKVADFLRVSRATVTQHVKLLDMPKDIQAKVHKGQLSAQSAFDLYSVKESQREQVLAKAEELAKEEEAEEAKKPKKAVKADKGEKAEAESGKIKRKHILEAARQSEALQQAKPRTRNEILALFSDVLESADPYADPIVDLFSTVVNRWATGQVGDRAVYNKLNALNELVADKPKKAVRKSA